jgi:hypothetical protein
MGAAIAFHTVFSLAPMLVIVITVAGPRKALADRKCGNRFIANILGRGYSFVAPVRRAQGQDTATLPNPSAAPRNNLPAELTRVIRRSEIVATVVARLAQQRSLTIVGADGIEKQSSTTASTLSAPQRQLRRQC